MFKQKRIQSTKVFDGYSTCFRQWRADGTHCKFGHGYAVYFKVWFEGEMDEKNWVMDFGRAKRSPVLIEGKTLKEYLDWLLDHTTIVAEDDPFLANYIDDDENGVIQLRVLPHVGAERFAMYLFDIINDWSLRDTEGRVRVVKLEFFEHNKNSVVIEEVEACAQETTIIEDTEKVETTDTEELKSDVKEEQYLSLFEFLGRPAGSALGQAVYAEAIKRNIAPLKKRISNKTGFSAVQAYPVSFLEDFFNK